MSGWGMSPRGPMGRGYDMVFPLSDHADFNELIEYVQRSRPENVLVTHGFPEFVYTLRDLGFKAQQLDPPEQGELL